MKKSILYISFFLVSLSLGISSCKKADFDNNYYNPEGAVNASIGSLYAGMFNNDRIIPRYWNLYTFQIPLLGEYSQTSGYSNGTKIYEQAINYTQDKWNDFYTQVIARFREVEKAYDHLGSDADKNGYQLFLETARIFMYDQAAQMVDLYGDIPFSEAGQLNATGLITLPKYDKAKDIYTFILSDLKRIADYLGTATPNDFYFNQFKKFDVLNSGSIVQWNKYANSLRLRLAMRISYSDETNAKSIVQEILSNSTKYPVVETVNENIQIKVSGSLQRTTDVREGFGINPFAPGYMVDSVMAPANDPRLPIFFSMNSKGQYHGVPNTWTASRVSDSTTAGYFSRYDSTTFTENNRFPGILLTAAEVSFLKAEAFERWGGGDAKAAYEDGIKKSSDYYYSINAGSTYTAQKPMPTALQITTYLANPIIMYGGTQQQKLERVATQKWIDFNVMQAQQAWAEWRRTKLPKLVFPVDPSSTASPNVPVRLLYPSSERTLNTANYEAVRANDVSTVKVFWDVK